MQVIKDHYIYKFSKENKPVAHAENGEVLRFLTRDCFNCQITSEEQTMETIDFEAPTPVFLPGKSHGQRSLRGCKRGRHD